MKITKKGNLGICFLVVKPTQYMTLSGVGWWVLSNFPNFPLNEHGVHLKILPPILQTDINYFPNGFLKVEAKAWNPVQH